MKKMNTLLLGVLLALGFSASTVRAQNDTMYVMKNGVVINKQSVKTTDVDSIVFYKVTTTPTCGGSVTFTYNGASVTYGTVASAGKCWLDRNLGATQVATSSTDHLSYGDLFQWGRGADGHQRITWTNATTGTAVNGTTATLSSTDTPVNAHFTTISNISGNLDWRSPQNDNLWQGVNGINNPCPSGYRLPTETELDAERSSWSSQYSTGAFASPLKLPVSGYRNYTNGLLYGVGSEGRYWSSTVSITNSRLLAFNSNGTLMYANYRAIGRAVRCLKD
jgi:hypothetical protein